MGPPRGVRLKERVGYAGAHYRVKVAKGRARDHVCSGCGTSAEEWAYVGDDPEELIELRWPKGIPRMIAYSVHPEHYRPLCKPCHARADAPNRGGAVKKIWYGAVALVAMLALAGCGSAQDDAAEVENPAEISVVEVHMPSGLTVDCVVWDSYREGGIDCDWDRAN